MNFKSLHIQVLFFVLLGLTIFFSGVSTSPYVEPVIKIFNSLIYPIMSIKNSIVREIEEAWETYIFLVNVQKRNKELEEKLQKLYLYEALYNECSLTLDKLDKDLNIEYSLKRLKTLKISIIGYDPTGKDYYVIINKGKRDGVKEGYIVVSRGMFIGVVGSVLQNTSKVYTVFNPKLKVSVVMEETGKGYIYEGGWPLGKLLHVNIDDKIKPGYEIRLRDLKRRIPSFRIGKVTDIRIGEDPFFKSVYVKPYVDLRKVEFAVLIKRSL